MTSTPSSTSCPKDLDDNSELLAIEKRERFLTMFIMIFVVGSLVFFCGLVAYDNLYATPGYEAWLEQRQQWNASTYAGERRWYLEFATALPWYMSGSAWCLMVCFFTSLLVLVLSRRLHNCIAPLVIFCVMLDSLLVLNVVADGNPRALYNWFTLIPLLLLYTHCRRSCTISAALVLVQTTILRFSRNFIVAQLSLDCDLSQFNHTLVGETIMDGWLFAILLLFCSGTHQASSDTLHRLQQVLDEQGSTNRQLQQATDAKSDFLANLTHELRTPMHGIIAMTRELQDMLPLNSKANRTASIISDCADHLLSLVNDILDFERIESHHFELEQIPFSIVAEAEKVIEMLSFTAKKKQLNLQAHVQVDHPLRIGDPVRYQYLLSIKIVERSHSNPHRFRQILFNLVSNAIKFTPERGSITITLTSKATCLLADHRDLSRYVHLAVKDTGIGISAEDIARLFTCFTQVDNSVSRKYGGSGLGLAICKRLCDVMGGSISCESELCKGSTFTVTLPLTLAQNANGDPLDEEESAADEKLDFSAMKFNGLCVLLVEDNLVNQKVGKRMLHTLGCEVTVVNNGVECIELMKERHFDVIFMDCQMPVMDGFQATQRLRELEKLKDSEGTTKSRPMPIVALTASATMDYKHKCLDAGMSDVLFKPLKREVLAAALHQWADPQLAFKYSHYNI